MKIGVESRQRYCN